MKSIISILLLVTFISAFSQQTTRIFGYVTDASTTLPVSNASVYFDGLKTGTVTDDKGFYSINLTKAPCTLIISHVSYQKRDFRITSLKTEKLDVELIPSEDVLPIVNITSPKPQKVISSESFFVQDYEFMDSNIMLLGFYYGQKPKLILLNPSGDTLAETTIYETTDKLYRDCLDNVHLLTEKNAYQVFYEADSLQLIYPVSRSEFDKTIPRCIEELNGKYYFREYYYENQVLLYFFKTADSTEKKLTLIADEKALRMLGDRERFIAMGKEYTEADKRFEDMFFYDPVYCPLYKINKQIFIINYVDSRIEDYNDSGKLLKTSDIDFHKDKYWKEMMAVDEAKGKLYAIFRKNGIVSLKEVNFNTGIIDKTIQVPKFPFIEKIRVKDGVLYFLYSNLVSQDKKMLYYMKLE